MMKRSFLLSLAALLLSACSLQLNSQYGLRIAPAEKGPRGTLRVPSAVAATPATATPLGTEGLEGAETADAAHYTLEALTDDSYASAIAVSPQPEEVPEGTAVGTYFEVTNVEAAAAELPVDEPLATATPPRSEPNMLTAWLMWGIPVVLMLTGLGFLLNFGLHWYYLGKQRRANSATFIWALTLAGYVAVGLLRFLKLGLLALLVFLIALIPLMVIQLIRAVKDAVLLNKISTRKARRSARTRGSSI
ncbi:MAG: hypothetical protein RL104_688 [Bacteroidota bacterium]